MIVKSHDGFLIASNSIRFVQRFRCQACDGLVRGEEQADGKLVCEECDGELHCDDEIAYRLDAER